MSDLTSWMAERARIISLADSPPPPPVVRFDGEDESQSPLVVRLRPYEDDKGVDLGWNGEGKEEMLGKRRITPLPFAPANVVGDSWDSGRNAFAGQTSSSTSRLAYSDYQQHLETPMKMGRFDEMWKRHDQTSEYAYHYPSMINSAAFQARALSAPTMEIEKRTEAELRHLQGQIQARQCGQYGENSHGHPLFEEEKRREELALAMLARRSQHKQNSFMATEPKPMVGESTAGTASLADGCRFFADSHSSSRKPQQMANNEVGGFFNTVPSMSNSRKRPLSQSQTMFDEPFFGFKQPRNHLISFPAAPPAVLQNYMEACRQSKMSYDVRCPLDVEAQSSVLELRQELAFIDSLDPSISGHLNNSKRLLDIEAAKMDEFYNPDWLEVDINRSIKLSKQVLIPVYRYPKINYVGRILGPKGSILQRICRKFKCFIAVLGAYSTKDRQQELELLQSGDHRYAHFASPMHIRIDIFGPAHLAHMRMAAVLNLFHKILAPKNEFDIEEYLADVDLEEKDGRPKTKNEKLQLWADEERRFEAEYDDMVKEESPEGRTLIKPGRGRGAFIPRHSNGSKEGNSSSDANKSIDSVSSTAASSRGAGAVPRAVVRGSRGGGFVPRGMRRSAGVLKAENKEEASN